MASPDISIPSLILCFLLLAVPLVISYRVKLHIVGKTINSVSRMTVQLFLVGVFLTYIFEPEQQGIESGMATGNGYGCKLYNYTQCRA